MKKTEQANPTDKFLRAVHMAAGLFYPESDVPVPLIRSGIRKVMMIISLIMKLLKN